MRLYTVIKDQDVLLKQKQKDVAAASGSYLKVWDVFNIKIAANILPLSIVCK